MCRLSCVSFILVAGLAMPSAEGTDMSTAFSDNIDSDSLIISFKNLYTSKIDMKKLLLQVTAHSTQSKFLIKLDRIVGKVIFETSEEKKDIYVPSLSGDHAIQSFILLIDQKLKNPVLTLYVNCNMEGNVTLKQTLYDMFEKKKLRVKWESKKNIELDVETDVQEVLDRHNCPQYDRMLADDAHMEVHHQIGRGDIPIMHDCDSNYLIQLIKQLIEISKKLREDLASQQAETRSLRRLLEQCDVCRPRPGEGTV